jgi:hypothetical protein
VPIIAAKCGLEKAIAPQRVVHDAAEAGIQGAWKLVLDVVDVLGMALIGCGKM